MRELITQSVSSAVSELVTMELVFSSLEEGTNITASLDTGERRFGIVTTITHQPPVQRAAACSSPSPTAPGPTPSSHRSVEL